MQLEERVVSLRTKMVSLTMPNIGRGRGQTGSLGEHQCRYQAIVVVAAGSNDACLLPATIVRQ